MQTAKLKKALPADLQKAERVTRDSERIVSNAHNEAQRMMSEARAESERLMTDAHNQAERTVQDARAHAEGIVEDARRESERIVADARQHAESLVAEHVITQRAQQVAEETQSAARSAARTLQQEADGYALDVLNRLGGILEKLLTRVEQEKGEIKQAEHHLKQPDQ